jgi:Undecaprenyl-phosphate glucose phosphotransferase
MATHNPSKTPSERERGTARAASDERALDKPTGTPSAANSSNGKHGRNGSSGSNGSNGANGAKGTNGSGAMARTTAPIPTAQAADGTGIEEQVTATPRALSADEAVRLAGHARQARHERVIHATPASKQSGPIPTLPPVPRAPARLTPLALMLAEMLLDAVALGTAFVLAYWFRFKSDITPRYAEPDNPTYVIMLGVTVATVIATFYFSKMYSLKRGASRVDEFYKTAASVSMGTLLSLAINSLILGDNFVYSRQMLLIGWPLAIAFVTIGRLIYGVGVAELRKHGIDTAKVLVIGTGPTAYAVVVRLDRHRTLGYKVLGLVDSTYGERGAPPSIGQVPVLGNLSNLVSILRREQVDEVIIALQGASDQDLRDILGLMKDESVSVKIYPDAFQLMTQNEVSVGELSGLPLLSVRDVALRGWNRRLKRAFDIAFSTVVLVLTSPILVAIAIAIKLSSPGPVFFIQERVGLDGKPFRLVKFRTMRMDSDAKLVPKLSDDLPGWTVPNDPRRTSVGAFLRRFSLDELPQFFNVLIGEMSVVGPRPEQPAYVKEFARRIPDYLRRHREKAGLTGWAQVNGFRGDSSIEWRTLFDIYYVENWSVLFDLKIIARTIVAMLRGKNAY